MSGKSSKAKRKVNQNQQISMGDFCLEMVTEVEKRLGPSALKAKAGAFQALAIMCFQRATELSADVIIEAVDAAFDEEMGVPPSARTKILEGVRMHRQQNALGVPVQKRPVVVEKEHEHSTSDIVDALKEQQGELH